MTPAIEGGSSWLDDLKDLILKKKEENAALKKIQESLQYQGVRNEDAGKDTEDEPSSADQTNVNTENAQNTNTNP